MKSRISTCGVAVTIAMAATFVAAAAQPAAASSNRTFSSVAGTVRGGSSQPIYSYADAIRESVWVDTGLDGDGDGKTDRVAVDIVRPREAAAQGQRVPVIMDASPYYSCCGRGNESQLKTYDATGTLVQAPLFYDNYFVPRGYAVVLVDLAGTNRSDGCIDIGGPSDIGSAKAVVNWLNGRAHGYRTRTGTTSVAANWTNGVTGMIGKSWDATIANGVAATGVKGLKTIVPISGISSWYDYYFQQAAPLQDGPEWLSNYVDSPEARDRCADVQQKIVAGSPRDGSWTAFWAQRNYVKDAGKVRASVFATAGMQDLNVRGKHFGQWWDALSAHGVERKVWLSQTGHVDPFDFRRDAWVSTLHQWFDHYLLGVSNGIERQPMADVERTPDHWTTDRLWPPSGTRSTELDLRAGSEPGLGTLGLKTGPKDTAQLFTTESSRTESSKTGSSKTESFTDDQNLWEEDWAASVDTSTTAKTSFSTGVLSKPLRLSGSGSVTVSATSSTTSAHLSAVLVDLGPQDIRNFLGAGSGINTSSTRSCFGQGTSGDTGCFLNTSADVSSVDHQIFSRGWADLGNSKSLTAGRRYKVTISLASTDHVIPAGHRLALIVAGTDGGLILPPDTTPTVTIDLARSAARLPLVGGSAALSGTGSSGSPNLAPDRLVATPAHPSPVHLVPGS